MIKTWQIIFAAVIGTLLSFSAALAQPNPSLQEVSTILVGEGDSALADGDLAGALRLYEQAVVSNPQNIEAYIGLGRLYLSAEILPSSLKYFNIALSLDPTNLATLELQSYAYLSQDSVDDAQSILMKMEQICIGRTCEEATRVSRAIEDHLQEIE